jgi:putative ABC transport system ATP-binding protein
MATGVMHPQLAAQIDHADGHISPRRRLLNLLRLESGGLWIAVVYSIAIGVLSLAVPVATQSLVNTIAFGNLLQPLVVLTLVVFIVLVLSAVLQMFRFQVVETLQRRVFVRIASESVERLLRARTDVLRLGNGPEIVNRFLEVVSLQKAGATLLVDGLGVAMQTIIGMLLLGLYHPWLLAFDAVLAVTLLLVLFPLGAHAVSTAVSESKAKYELVAWLQEIARNSTSFRGSEQAGWATWKTDKLVAKYLDYRSKHFRILLRQFGGTLALQAMASALLLGVGGLLVINRQLTLGQLVAAELVVTAVVAGISKVAKHLESYYDLLASLDKLGYLTSLPDEASGSELLPGSQAPALVAIHTPQLDAKLTPGRPNAVTGPSGSGKTTFMDAICGYRVLPGCSVAIDGIDIRHLRLAELRSSVGLVRGNEIFHGTVLENICVGRSGVGAGQVQQTLEGLGVWDQVQRLPDGLDTILATGGAPLSEGVALVLMIARAVVARPRLLILDETLDQILDMRERELLTEALFGESQPWTLLVATSRADLIERCATVIQMPEDK